MGIHNISSLVEHVMNKVSNNLNKN